MAIEIGATLSYQNELDGGRGRNRTFNLSVKSRMLCQLSYASNGLERPLGGIGLCGCAGGTNAHLTFKNIAEARGNQKAPLSDSRGHDFLRG